PEYVEAGIHVLLSIGSLRKAGQNLVKGARYVVKKATKEGAGEAAGEAAKSATKAAAKEGAKATSKATTAPAAAAAKAPAAKSAQNGAKPKPEKGKQKVTDGSEGVSASASSSSSSSSSATHVTQPKAKGGQKKFIGEEGLPKVEVKPGEQPWNIRPGQEWKGKIVGKAQKTGTPGHQSTSYREAIGAAKRENVDAVLLNRGANRLLPEGQKIRANTRADVTVRTKDGKLHQTEVPSKTDNPRELKTRMETTKDKLPESMQGRTDVRFIGKEQK
ncbi:MAG: hypothetical protein ACK5VW_06830, partial [Holosporales bacterium]